MQVQVNSPNVIKTKADLKQALSDLEFYGSLAITKGQELVQELWAEEDAVVSSFKTTKRVKETSD